MPTDIATFRGIALTEDQVAARKAGKGFSFNPAQCVQLDASGHRERSPDGYRLGAPVMHSAPSGTVDNTDHGPAAAALRDAQAFAEKHSPVDDGEDHVTAALRAARLH